MYNLSVPKIINKLNNMGKRSKLLVFFIVIAVVAVLTIFIVRNGQNKSTPDKTIAYSTNSPSEKKPNKNTYKWVGSPDEPKYITLPTINAGGFVQKVGVDQNNQIAVPDNTHMAGWFSDSVKPGSQGLSIIDGHVSGRINSDGIFRDLVKLKIGDKFDVELGNGKKLNYKVTQIVQVPTKNAPSVLFSQDPKSKSQLNLITCGGKFNLQTKQYDDRIIVYSELS